MNNRVVPGVLPVVGGFTARGTTFVIGVEELGVFAVLLGMAVNDEGNLHALEATLLDTGDGDQVPPIGVPPCPCGGRPRDILPVDSSKGWRRKGTTSWEGRLIGYEKYAAIYVHRICVGFYVVT